MSLRRFTIHIITYAKVFHRELLIILISRPQPCRFITEQLCWHAVTLIIEIYGQKDHFDMVLKEPNVLETNMGIILAWRKKQSRDLKKKQLRLLLTIKMSKQDRLL